MNCLLLDIGSTFIKYGVYDDSLKVTNVLRKTEFPSSKIQTEKKFIVSRKLIEDKIFGIFEELEAYNLRKAFISVQMHGYILKMNDGSFSDYVSWRDKSGETNQERLKRIDFGLMGTSLKSNLPAVKIRDCNEKTEFFTLGSYISAILTGNNSTHITDACASGYFYADSGESNELAQNMTLPNVYKQITKVGKYQGIDIYTPVGDHQVSFLGSGAGKDSYLINIGTAAQVSCLFKEETYANCEHRPYFNDKYRLYTVSGLNDGAGLNDKERFFKNLVDAIGVLPSKSRIVFGGGGSTQIYPFLKEKFEKINISCEMFLEGVGMDGLKIIAERDKIKCGTMLSEIAFYNFPIIAKKSGLDFIIIDSEHGAFDWSSLSAIIMNANLIGIDAIVRVGDASRAIVTKLADMGAKGFLLPMTSTKEEIEELVKFTKYSPLGKRGISTTRAHTLYFPPSLEEYKQIANERMKIFAQIETKKGVDNIYDILNTVGVDGVFVGPNDLSDDLRVKPVSEEVMNCIEKISNVASSVCKEWGIITADKTLIAYAENHGARLISCGSELNMLVSGCKKIAEEIK